MWKVKIVHVVKAAASSSSPRSGRRRDNKTRATKKEINSICRRTFLLSFLKSFQSHYTNKILQLIMFGVVFCLSVQINNVIIQPAPCCYRGRQVKVTYLAVLCVIKQWDRFSELQNFFTTSWAPYGCATRYTMFLYCTPYYTYLQIHAAKLH